MNQIQRIFFSSRSNVIITFLFFLWLLIGYSLPRHFDAHNPFDHSWMTVMARLVDDSAFTYGKLSWVFMPDLGEISYSKILLRIIFCFCLLLPLFDVLKKSRLLRKLTIFFACLIIFAAPYFKYDVLFYLSYWLLLSGGENSVKRDSFSAVVWSFIAPFYKFSFFPLALLLNLFYFTKNKENRIVFGVSSVSLILSTLLIDSLWPARLSYSLGYSEYLAGYQQESFALAISMIVFGLGLIWVFFQRMNRFKWVLVLISLFIQYKHAVVLGTPGYAFYLFFIPLFFLLIRSNDRKMTSLAILSLWMLPFHLHHMGGARGLLTSFSRSLIFLPNLPSEVSPPNHCTDEEVTLILDHFDDYIASPCAFKTFPSLQFYGFSPYSQLAQVNTDYLTHYTPKKIVMNVETFGNRNAIGEISYLLPYLINHYDLEQNGRKVILSKREVAKNKKLICSSETSSSLAFIKLKCSPSWSMMMTMQNIVYKSPELSLVPFGRVFNSSLKHGVFLYAGPGDSIYRLWSGDIEQERGENPILEVVNGAGPFKNQFQTSLNECLDISFCKIDEGGH